MQEDLVPESTSLPVTITRSLSADFPQLQPMLNKIAEKGPEISAAISHFGKTQSQFMDNFLTLAFPTPSRNLHQCLAQIEQVRSAMRETHFKILKTDVKIRKKEIEIRQLETDHAIDLESNRDNVFKAQWDLLHIQVEEIKAQREASKTYLAGAVRRYANYLNQYEKIRVGMGLKEGEPITEEKFEAYEEEYHIKRAFEQALHAARSHGGVIDEGNHIYLYQIGINGTQAQREVFNYLSAEGKAVDANIAIGHNSMLDFLDQMAIKFKGCSKRFGEYKSQLWQDPSTMFG